MLIDAINETDSLPSKILNPSMLTVFPKKLKESIVNPIEKIIKTKNCENFRLGQLWISNWKNTAKKRVSCSKSNSVSGKSIHLSQQSITFKRSWKENV